MRIWLIAHTFLLDQQGRLLLLRRSAQNDVLPLVWDIPGGSCEPGEDPLIAAQRETKEETGLDIHDPYLLAHTSNIDLRKDTQFVRCIFSARATSTDVRLNPSEHDQYAWVDMEHITSAPTVDYLDHVIRQYRERRT